MPGSTSWKKSHPNICKYYRCIRDGNYIAGICLQKYKYTSEDNPLFLLTNILVSAYWNVNAIHSNSVLRSRLPHFDTYLILAGIKAGLDWLHGLRLFHDDINPSNIMLDNGGHGVIIDFDSCASIGAESRGGAPGWSTRKAPPGTSRLTVKTSPRLPGGEDAGSSIHLENVHVAHNHSMDSSLVIFQTINTPL